MRVLRWVFRVLLLLLLLGGIGAYIYRQDIREMRAVWVYANAFKPGVIEDNFRNFHREYPSATIQRAGPVHELPESQQSLPASFLHGTTTQPIENWIDVTQTTGLIVIKDGKIMHERYLRGNNKDSLAIGFSVTKSVVSFLVGKAVQAGQIKSLNDAVDSYDPALKKGGYAGVSIKDVLQMSSGIRFTEDYGDLNSDIVRYIVALLTGSVNDFTAALPKERQPGTYLQYTSANTQVLGMVLEAATGKPLAELAREHLWSKLGAQADAKMSLDTKGTAVAAGGLHATLRDYARIGLLYLNQGRNFAGEQLIDPAWVQASVTPDAPHLQPGRDGKRHYGPWGYGYQWWIPENPEGDFVAMGIYGQFVYVHPAYNVVIAKTSAYLDYNETGPEMELEAISAFRAIAKGLSLNAQK